MKKKLILIVGILSLLLLTGCQNQNSVSETKQLKEQISKLEQEVKNLKKQSQQSESNHPATEDTTENIKQETTEKPAQDSTDQTDTQEGQSETQGQTDMGAGQMNLQDSQGDVQNDTVEKLTELVEEYVARAEASKPEGTEQEQMDKFLNLKREGNDIEERLDLYEDKLEQKYRNGEISWEEYRAEERKIEALEDRLDRAEDTLEAAYGIKD